MTMEVNRQVYEIVYSAIYSFNSIILGIEEFSK